MPKQILKFAPHEATHFLSYPLYNPRSSSQLQNLVQILRDDEKTAGCSQKAFRLPKSFHLRTSRFRFESLRDVENASKLLHSLDVNGILRHAAIAAVRANANNQNDRVMETSVAENGIGRDSRVPPLYVSLKGVSTSTRWRHPDRILSVYSVAEDPSNRLHLLSSQIFEKFISAGFKEHISTVSPEYRASKHLSIPDVNLLNNFKATKTQTVLDDKGRKYKTQEPSQYDPRGLMNKYNNVVLADNISLERLSLCKNRRIATFRGGRNEILLDEYYEEIASIPLPLEA